MIIAVGSKNPVKINAAQIAFSRVFPEKEITVKHAEVNSGVPEQPWGEDTIRGAINRAKKVIKIIEGANFGIGIEGGLEKNNFGFFTYGWVAVTNKTGGVGLARTTNVQVPKKLIDLMKKKNLEMGHALDKLLGTNNIKQKQGYIGYATNNLITRTDAYVGAIISALARFMKPEFF